MSNLALVKSENFGNIQCDFYQNDDNITCLTSEQLGACLGYAEPRKSISNLVNRFKYLKDSEFSGVIKLVTPGGIQETRMFTEDGIYEITMLAKTEKSKTFRAWIRKVLKSIRTGQVALPEYLAKDPILAIRYDQLQMKDQITSIEEKVTKLEENSSQNLEVPVLPVSKIEIQAMEHTLKRNKLSTTQIAEMYGMGAVSFYRLLHTLGFIQPAEDIKGWVLDPKYVGKGVGSNNNNGHTGDSAYAFVYWTPKGRELIEETLRYNGVKPIKRLAQKKKTRKRNTPKKAGTVV